MKRDDYTRCRHCKQLFLTADATRDPDTGAYQCPNGCKTPFEQPPYESPLNS
jgi:hypothetical protein